MKFICATIACNALCVHSLNLKMDPGSIALGLGVTFEDVDRENNNSDAINNLLGILNENRGLWKEADIEGLLDTFITQVYNAGIDKFAKHLRARDKKIGAAQDSMGAKKFLAPKIHLKDFKRKSTWPFERVLAKLNRLKELMPTEGPCLDRTSFYFNL